VFLQEVCLELGRLLEGIPHIDIKMTQRHANQLGSGHPGSQSLDRFGRDQGVLLRE